MGSDYVHRCNSSKLVLDREPVLKTGDWTDYTGSGAVASPQFQGFGSKASGKPKALGVNIDTMNRWGKRTKLYRERQHLEYIPIEVK